jgi:lactate dehydrogenase-like 2-hydroxyacid dehydrogenase
MTNRPQLLQVARLPEIVTEALGAHFVLHDLGPVPDPARLRGVAPDVRGIVAHGESVVGRALLDQLPHLELVAVFGVGYDGVDVAAARARGVQVTHTPGVLTDDVADLALALLLATARQVCRADRFVRDGRWPAGPYPFTRKVSGARLGIIGLGRIGMAVARRAEGFAMTIAYHNRRPRLDVPYRYASSPLELAASVDFLVVCAPGGDDSRHLVDAAVIAALGPTGILVNVGRGPIVDEAAVAAALGSGQLLGAGLDVFEHEPAVLPALLGCDNVVLTPHIASGTAPTRRAMGDLLMANLLAHFAGQPVPTPVPTSST